MRKSKFQTRGADGIINGYRARKGIGKKLKSRWYRRDARRVEREAIYGG